MTFEFEYHPTVLIITPALAVEISDCENPACGATHCCISFGWLVGSVSVYLEW